MGPGCTGSKKGWEPLFTSQYTAHSCNVFTAGGNSNINFIDAVPHMPVKKRSQGRLGVF